MNILEIKDSSEWESFVSAQSKATILQSWSWKMFLQAEGFSPRALFVKDNQETLAACLIGSYPQPSSKVYVYSPRGPIFKDGVSLQQQTQAVQALAAYIGQQFGSRIIFWRLDPAFSAEENVLKNMGLKKANKEMQPQHTIVVDIASSEQEILARMKQKARYNIRLAEKKGVTVKQTDTVDQFYSLLIQTAQRDNFHISPKSHYQNIWNQLLPEHRKIYQAYYQDKAIAAIMVTCYNGQAIYLHGASNHEYRNLMAPYLLQWHAMQQAKKAGAVTYDLWGVAPQGQLNHVWSGITHFKEGFGGEYMEYAGSYDWVYSKLWYSAFNIVRLIRRRIRV
jgi:lipid II:glycine glycyltransferase (peptidoglycan interpeptide bridge formation enzyme)